MNETSHFEHFWEKILIFQIHFKEFYRRVTQGNHDYISSLSCLVLGGSVMALSVIVILIHFQKIVMVHLFD